MHLYAGLWEHKKHKLNFTLFVDNFGIKFTKDNAIHHLINMLQRNTLWAKIGQAADTVAKPLIWIITPKHVISPCQATLKVLYKGSSIHSLINHNICHMNSTNHTTAQKYSIQTMTTIHWHWMQKTTWKYEIYCAHSYIMHVLWIPPGCWQSALLLISKLTQLKKQWKCSHKYSIAVPSSQICCKWHDSPQRKQCFIPHCT